MNRILLGTGVIALAISSVVAQSENDVICFSGTTKENIHEVIIGPGQVCSSYSLKCAAIDDVICNAEDVASGRVRTAAQAVNEDHCLRMQGDPAYSDVTCCATSYCNPPEFLDLDIEIADKNGDGLLSCYVGTEGKGALESAIAPKGSSCLVYFQLCRAGAENVCSPDQIQNEVKFEVAEIIETSKCAEVISNKLMREPTCCSGDLCNLPKFATDDDRKRAEAQANGGAKAEAFATAAAKFMTGHPRTHTEAAASAKASASSSAGSGGAGAAASASASASAGTAVREGPRSRAFTGALSDSDGVEDGFAPKGSYSEAKASARASASSNASSGRLDETDDFEGESFASAKAKASAFSGHRGGRSRHHHHRQGDVDSFDDDEESGINGDGDYGDFQTDQTDADGKIIRHIHHYLPADEYERYKAHEDQLAASAESDLTGTVTTTSGTSNSTETTEPSSTSSTSAGRKISSEISLVLLSAFVAYVTL